MLVGSPPYRSAEMVEQLDTAGSLPERLKRYRDTIYSSPPPKLHYRRRGVDKQLCQIVDQCLSKRAEHRFSNVQQVLQSLQRRDSAKLKQPIYLLGIVAPILLSVLMMMFSMRSMGVAKLNSLAAVHDWSLTNHLQRHDGVSAFDRARVASHPPDSQRVVHSESNRRSCLSGQRRR